MKIIVQVGLYHPTVYYIYT